MRIGLFGGTFDPVHNGHISIAEAAIQAHGLDKVYICPSAIPPWKPETTTGLHHRFAMVTLACSDDAKLVPIALGASGYTAVEISDLRQIHPADELFYVMGMDAWLTLEKWADVQDIIRWVDKFVVAVRPGFCLPLDAPQTGVWETLLGKTEFLTQVYLPIAATDIRRALQNREPVGRFLVNPLVLEYIMKTGIYQCGRCTRSVG